MKNQVNVKTLKSLLLMTEAEIYDYLLSKLECYYSNVIKDKYYIIAEGNIPIFLIAHLDTVFEGNRKDLITINNIITTKRQGLGGDDRAGVYMILKILEKGFRPHIIFTLDEEKNAKGAFSLIKKFISAPPFDAKMLIELDRRGRKEGAFYDCMNEKFIKYIESFGYEYTKGTFTDIRVFSPAWNVAAVNLSCGYYREHTLSEYINLTDLDYSLNKVIRILNDINNASYYKFTDR